ncbi:MAG: hypothetical protein HOK65_13150 [Crocinitomicaceae bacterium]|jgi:hypothetical protein|nr:hypothetical protein [Crocinitomicaceae bacterium]
MSVTEASRRIPRPSHNYVPEYQMSGIPHVETRTLAARANNAVVITNIASHKFTFGSVTRWIVINNHSADATKHLRVYFNETAAKTAYSNDEDDHYFVINGDEQTQRLEIKCKELYLITDTATNTFEVSVIAGLTNVVAEDFPDQAKANGFLGVED